MLVVVGLMQGAAAGQRPLPESESFYEAVKANIARAEREQNHYAYRERRTDVHTNPFGRFGTGGTRLTEVVPDEEGKTALRRILERDDRPVDEGAGEQINLPQRRNTSRNTEDITRTLSFTVSRREYVDGQAMIVIDFEPRPDAKPTTRQGRLARVFKGSLWVNESEQEVARIEAVAIRDLSFGLGLIARIRKGATITAERRPVDGGIWLPTSLRLTGEGRAVLFRKLDVDFAVDWFDYRLIRPSS